MYYIEQLTNTRSSDGGPEPDGDLKVVDRKKNLHYHQLYIDHPEPMVLIPATVDTSDRIVTSDRIYDDFLRLFLKHPHR